MRHKQTECVQFRHNIFFQEISIHGCLSMGLWRSVAHEVAGESLAWQALLRHPESGLDGPHALPYSSTLPYPFVMQHVMGAAFGRHTECYRLVHGSEGDGDGVLPQDCELHLFIHLQIRNQNSWVSVSSKPKAQSFLAWS